MNKWLSYTLKYILFWLLYFTFSRLVFLLYNASHTFELPIGQVFKSFMHGIKLDISMVGYLMLVLLVFFAMFMFFRNMALKRFVRFYTLIFIVIFTLIIMVDVELYRNWGFRIDSTVLLYLKTPKESLASTPVYLVFLLLVACLLVIWFWIKVYINKIEPIVLKLKPVKWYYAFVFLVLSASMIVPIRGGLGIAPINAGSVFFSKFQFANHASLNCIWNLGNSISTMNQKQSIQFMDNNLAETIVDKMLLLNNKKAIKLVEGEHPNIVILILESFNNGIIGPLGGIENACPNLNEIANEGVLFSKFYASGDRSDKGIVSVLSGYPAQPTTSIIKFTKKAEKLPHLSKVLGAHGYSSGFYYGGEINFANMNSYFVSGNYETMVTLDQFSKKDLNSKWGAHDHVVFQRLFDDINSLKQPFFRVMFTLSSHEPFDVPHKSIFSGANDESKYLNSVHYTDSCIGDFISKAKNTEWWNNTWIILIADHGSRWPGNVPYESYKKFQIPMIWTGGAVKKDTVISKTASQVDVPKMIENQLNINDSLFYFSKDVLSNDKAFAFYAFNNGFGYVNDSLGFIWNNTSNKTLDINEIGDTILIEGKAFMQILLNDFNNK